MRPRLLFLALLLLLLGTADAAVWRGRLTTPAGTARVRLVATIVLGVAVGSFYCRNSVCPLRGRSHVELVSADVVYEVR